MSMFEEIKQLTKELVAVASVNGTAGERDIADTIEQYLRAIPYFSAHPELVVTRELNNDTLGRKNVLALLKGGDGTYSKTIMLHGHTDTVGVEDFGKWKSYAYDCDALQEVLRDADLPEDARRDLLSGDYLFGRGACDMKGGDAVFLVLAKHLATQAETLRGNLLFSFNPVEETLHQGIIEALPVIDELKEKHNLEFLLAINNDFICPMYQGDTTRYVYTGAVGKLLPMFYIIGRETHVAQCYEGFNVDLAAAELVRRIDLNPKFCDGYKGEYTLPPTTLKMQDLKPSYNVQTPHTAVCYFNYFVHNRQLTEILDLLKAEAKIAMEHTTALAGERYQAYCALSGKAYAPITEPVQVLSYDELYAKAEKAYQGNLDAVVKHETEDSMSQGDDKRISSLRIVQKLAELTGIKRPTVVVFFATPYCPHNTLKSEVAEEQTVHDKLSVIAENFSQKSGEAMLLQQFFPSLTDSSYLKMDDDDASVRTLRQNFPGYDALYPVPLEQIRRLNPCPKHHS